MPISAAKIAIWQVFQQPRIVTTAKERLHYRESDNFFYEKPGCAFGKMKNSG